MAFDINIGLHKLLVFIAINSFKLIVCLNVSDWYLLGVKPHPDCYLLGVHLQFPDEHSRPFCMGAPPPARLLHIGFFGKCLLAMRELFINSLCHLFSKYGVAPSSRERKRWRNGDFARKFAVFI